MKVSIKKIALYTIIGIVIITLSGCATQPGASGGAGFFTGFWHGICAPFSLIGSIFMDIRVYEFPNSGWWYDFGFMLGLGALGGGGGAAANAD